MIRACTHMTPSIYLFYQPLQFFICALLLLFLLLLCFPQLPLCTDIVWVVLVVCSPCLHTGTKSNAFLCVLKKRKTFCVVGFSRTACSSVVTLSSPSCSWMQMSLLWKTQTKYQRSEMTRHSKDTVTHVILWISRFGKNMNWWLKWEWKNDNRASIMSFALQKCMAVCSWVSACSSTFFARRCVYSTQCVRGWVRKLLQLSLSPLWSLLSWRVWDSRVSHTWDTELLLGSFLSVVMHKQEKK